MTIERRLYIEYRVFVNPESNQDMLHEQAKHFQEYIHDEWNNGVEYDEHSFVECHDVTYEVVMELAKVKETE